MEKKADLIFSLLFTGMVEREMPQNLTVSDSEGHGTARRLV